MKKFNILLWISILSFIATIILIPYLPEQIPIHWNIKGQVDNYAQRNFALVLAGIPILTYVLFYFLPKIDPKRENYKKHIKSYKVIIFSIIIFLIIINWVTLGIALGVQINIALVINGFVGILFIVLGNEMPRIRHNYFVGIKTPWTIADERTWKKTHRIGGYIFSGLGLFFIISSLINNETMFIITLMAVIGGVIFLFLYSYLVFRKLNIK